MQAGVLEGPQFARFISHDEDRSTELLKTEEVTGPRHSSRGAGDHPSTTEDALFFELEKLGIRVSGPRNGPHQPGAAQPRDLGVFGSFGSRHGPIIAVAQHEALNDATL